MTTEEDREGTFWTVHMRLAEDKLGELDAAEDDLERMLKLPSVIPIGKRVAALGARIRQLREDAADLLDTDPLMLERD